jgi:hypothetical protein
LVRGLEKVSQQLGFEGRTFWVAEDGRWLKGIDADGYINEYSLSV